MSNYVVYRHIRLDKNEPFYIGIGNEKRPYEKRRRNKYWQNITFKSNYKIDILFNDLTWGQACEKEKELIQLYGRKDLSLGTLVNLTDGGDGTLNTISWNKGKSGLFKHSDETKKHLSELRKNKPLTGKQIESLKNRKKTQYWLGKKLSDEHKAKLADVLRKRWEKGDFNTPEMRQVYSNQGKSMKGSKRTDEQKQKMSNAHKGKDVSHLHTPSSILFLPLEPDVPLLPF